MSIYIFKHLNIWKFEHLNIWSSEHMKIWASEHLYIGTCRAAKIVESCHPVIWIFEHLNILTFDHLNIWISEHLNIWASEHLNIWTFKSRCTVIRTLGKNVLKKILWDPRRSKTHDFWYNGTMVQWCHVWVIFCSYVKIWRYSITWKVDLFGLRPIIDIKLCVKIRTFPWANFEL